MTTPASPPGSVGLGWMADAVCDGRSALFFSETADGRDAAKRMCLYRCPVLAECRAWRDRVRPSHGIWGGRGAKATTAEQPKGTPAR
ncbi:MAG: WhiB family transcriptional regulator [Nocardioides sp.]